MQVPEIFSPLPNPAPVVAVEDTSGRPLFTFSSETASLIKFLSVAAVVPSSCSSCSNRAGSKMVGPAGSCDNKHSDTVVETPSNLCAKNCNQHNKPEASDSLISACSGTGLLSTGETVKGSVSGTMAGTRSKSTGSSHCSGKVNTGCENNCDLKVIETSEAVTDNSEDSDTNLIIKPKKIKVDSSDVTCSLKQQRGSSEQTSDCSANLQNENLASGACSCDKTDKSKDISSSDIEYLSPGGDSNVTHPFEQSKNLIFVTGEFAVALHQLGFKNVPRFNECSARRRTLGDNNPGDGYMVVNYSNNNIHIVQRQESHDKPDNLIDLFGHVTGLCLSEDQR